jgi:DNA-binding MarR family transcriptional regulator
VPAAAARPLSDREYQLLARFRAALRTFARHSEQAARLEGVTPAQHQLLLAIRGHPGGSPSTTETAGALQLTRHAVVELVDRAVAAGLVTRRPDPADRRRQLLGLTRRGEARLGRLSVFHRDELRRFRLELADVLRELDPPRPQGRRPGPTH